MSLLLDALKKAADDKKKISNAESVENAGKDEIVNASETSNAEADVALSLEEVVETAPLNLDGGHSEDSVHETELTLDEQTPDTNKSPQYSKQNSKAEKFVISDDGLSLLIHKTNHDIKKNKKVLYISVIAATMLILVVGGFYYYSEMQAEIASLERKHQISMQSMRSKTNTNHLPERSDIIRNLVGNADLDKKVKFAKDTIADGSPTTKKLPKTDVPKKRLNTTPFNRYLLTWR